jgi:hypothetical protein
MPPSTTSIFGAGTIVFFSIAFRRYSLKSQLPTSAWSTSRKKLPNLDIIEKWTQVHHIGHTARSRLRRWITKEHINWVNPSEAVRWAESSVYKAALEDLPTTYYMASPTSTRIVSNGICVLKNSFGVHIAYNSF